RGIALVGHIEVDALAIVELSADLLERRLKLGKGRGSDMDGAAQQPGPEEVDGEPERDDGPEYDEDHLGHAGAVSARGDDGRDDEREPPEVDEAGEDESPLLSGIAQRADRRVRDPVPMTNVDVHLSTPRSGDVLAGGKRKSRWVFVSIRTFINHL